MIKKVSLSLPSELLDEISQEYPDVPTSRIVAKLIRAGLDSTKSPISHTAVVPVPTGITDTTELANIIRSIVRDELTQANQAHQSIVITDPVVIENRPIPVPDVQPNTLNNDPEWLTNSDIYQMIADKYPRSTGTAKISRAVSQGKLVTNGKRRTDMRITKESALSWLQTI